METQLKRQKTGGRQAGTPNVMTTVLRHKLKVIIEAELENIPELLNELTPDQRISAILKLCSFCLPKVQSVTYLEGENFWDC